MAFSVQTAVQEQKTLCPKVPSDLVRHWEDLTRPSHRPSPKMQQPRLVLPIDKVAAEVAWAHQAAVAGCFV